MISKFASLRRHILVNPLLATANRRFYATGAAQKARITSPDDEYSVFEEQAFYTPTRKVDFSSGRATIFYQDVTPNKMRYVPYEVKESTIKNWLGVVMMGALHYLLSPSPYLYTFGSAIFSINWVYTVYSYMSNAVSRVDLHEDGKTVTLTFKSGGTTTVQIKDIKKKKHEKELVQTFEECFLFPIAV